MHGPEPLCQCGGGGLGVRSVSSLALPAFLASSIASFPLVEALMPQGRLGPLHSVMAEAEASWLVSGELTIAPKPMPVAQKDFDDPVCRAQFGSLLSGMKGAARASMLAAAAPRFRLLAWGPTILFP